MIKNFLYNYFIDRKISFKLMILTLLFSAVITLIISIIQLYMDYRNGIKSINTQLSLIESGYIASINQSIWVYDKKQTLLQLDGILNLPDIEFTAIELTEGEHYERGNEVNKNFITKKIQLSYQHDYEEIILGELTVVADLNKLYQQLVDKIIVILLSQGIKTFLISFFILFIFQRLVTQHLEKIAEYAKSLRVYSKSKPLILNKTISKSNHDELDNLTESINSMQNQLYKSFLNLSSELEARKKSDRSLLEYKKALDASAYVSKSDLNGDITYVNDALCSITGYTREELIGKQHNIFRYKETPPIEYKEMWDTIQNKKVWRGSMKNVKKDGSCFYISQTIIPILDTHGNIIEYIALRYDITELVEKTKMLERHYETDTLTKLGNRFKLLNDIENSEHPSLAIVDIDSFKQINDFYGHEIGDYVIIELSKRLLEQADGRYTEAYRLQADQFAFICKACTTKDQFKDTIENLIKELTKKPIFFQQHEIIIGVTVGIATNKQDLFIDADIGLKLAKQLKKDFVIYDKAFNIEKEYENNLEWTKKVKKAIEDGRIVAFFQPIYNQNSKKVEKFEALVRMIDIDGKIISPFFFLEIAKKAKLYTKITMIMIDKAIEAAKHHDYEFSINLTIDDIINQETTDYFIQKVRESNIGHKIVIELVESEGIENFNDFYSFIEKAKLLGCKLAIDDFGTGYSNFEYLLKLDVDYVKIDGSLIKNIDTNKHMRLVSETIISFAKIANMKTIAEFVSHKKISDIVSEIGVDFIQGYYIGEPMPYNEIEKFEHIVI
ncbi:EAL domain-containing protein [Candidatus Sulfurimonas marisnigri]|uniref:EAL domain-containing protein n=1 Tax=Candidatus Sulfurimonas marisnigri TaxID=2740405 RepID=A0A7S7LZP7_9BACT|nr:EAL domain-containing protein [Candidatus Sulfurimonas marisnigri]QOY53853.1 EAL domain-containing protein [Candidatus Sulfurimonas marisnigri]